jgi:hypothetical protein
MKKLKRILLCTLTSAMTLSMLPTTAAFAAGVDDPITEIPVYKTVTVETKGTLLPTEKFAISMVPATEEELNPVVDGTATPTTDANGQTIEAGPALKEDTVIFTFDATDNTASGSVQKNDKFKMEFKEAFDHTGVYRYYVTEKGVVDAEGNTTNTDNGYITFDKTKYVVDLYVDQNKDGDFVVANVVTTIPDKNTKPQTISFTNAIDCATLKIYKEVEGTEYQAGELYNFRILIPVGGTTIVLEDGQKIQARICDVNGTVIDTENGRTDEEGNIEFTVQGANLSANMATYGNAFQLKKGEWLELIGVPVTMVYKVEEVTDTDQFKKEGYTVTYDYKEYGSNKNDNTGYVKDQKGSVVSGTINTDTNEVTFRNTRNIEVPNSGISVDVIPYVLILLVVVCGGFLFFFNLKKRRTAR